MFTLSVKPWNEALYMIGSNGFKIGQRNCYYYDFWLKNTYMMQNIGVAYGVYISTKGSSRKSVLGNWNKGSVFPS